jgi:hypothetical protein
MLLVDDPQLQVPTVRNGIVYNNNSNTLATNNEFYYQGSVLHVGKVETLDTITTGTTFKIANIEQTTKSPTDPGTKGELCWDANYLYVCTEGVGVGSGVWKKIELGSTVSGGGSGFSGDYNDLTNKPTLFGGSYNDLTDKPTLFDGAYSSLSGTPTIPTSTSDLTNDSGFITLADVPSGGGGFSGSYNDLTNKPTLFSGDYTDLSNKPTLFSGSYADLTNKPTIPTIGNIVFNGENIVTNNTNNDIAINPANSWDNGNSAYIIIPNHDTGVTHQPIKIVNKYASNSAANAAVTLGYDSNDNSKIVTVYGDGSLNSTGNISADGDISTDGNVVAVGNVTATGDLTGSNLNLNWNGGANTYRIFANATGLFVEDTSDNTFYAIGLTAI